MGKLQALAKSRHPQQPLQARNSSPGGLAALAAHKPASGTAPWSGATVSHASSAAPVQQSQAAAAAAAASSELTRHEALEQNARLEASNAAGLCCILPDSALCGGICGHV